MISFTNRNLKVFFKDKTAVFFSLLSVFIIIGLYVFFLGDIWINNFRNLPSIKYLMDTWLFAGLLTVVSLTSSMGAFGIMVDDKMKKIEKDFIVSPIDERKLVGGYILGAIIVGVIMSLVALVLFEVYFVLNGSSLIWGFTLVKVILLIILSTVANSSLVFFIVSFFKSNNAFATASTVIGTLIGFLTGIYLPIGQLPSNVQMIIKCFPPSHAGSLLRNVMMEGPMATTFANVPEQYIASFKESMGINFVFGDTVVTPLASIIILICTGLVFYGLSIINLSRKKK